VPPKLSARARLSATGQGRKTDATDAHSVALAGTRISGLRPVVDDARLAVLRVLVDRRRSLGDDHTRTIAQLHHLLLQLIPGGAKKNLSAAQAQALLASVRPRDTAGKARRFARRSAPASCERDSRAARSGSGARPGSSSASAADRSSKASSAAGKNSRSALRSRSTCRVRSQVGARGWGRRGDL
jgi:Transposase